ncbi:MAG: ParB/RepB/Spo0J family partition protein [Pseudomonadota bacterium]
MKFLHGGQVQRLDITRITIGPRLRQVSEAQIATLLLMAEDTGITTPIHVRRVEGRYDLIDGAHRLEAARRRGDTEIAALVVECRADEARAMEASNNLGAARMTPLQTAVFVASWKRDYYALHPERAAGVFKGNQHRKINENKDGVVTDIMSLTTAIAASLGTTERHVWRLLNAGERLTPEEIAALEAAPRKVLLKDLVEIGRIGEDDERAAVVEALRNGVAKSAAEARRKVAAAASQAPSVKDPVEEAFKRLIDAWDRAPMAAKKRFLLDRAREVWDAQNRGARLTSWQKAAE